MGFNAQAFNYIDDLHRNAVALPQNEAEAEDLVQEMYVWSLFAGQDNRTYAIREYFSK
jgi:DNA-directed RNA polymerase specialized sigma24 family protein